MADFYNNISCKRCGSSRSSNLRTPCPMCGSRQIPLIGYTYRGERSQILTLLIILLILLVVAAASGALYIFIKTIQIQLI